LKRLLTILFLFVIILGCGSKFPNYIEVEDNVYMNLISFEDESKPYEKGDYVFATIRIKDGNALRYNRNKAYPFQPKATVFDEIFNHLNEGDSAVFRINQQQLDNDSFLNNLPEFDEEYAELTIKIDRYVNESQYEKFIAENDFEMIEQIVLKQYLKENDIDEANLKNGIYKIVKKEGSGEGINSSKKVKIKYIGKFIDNVVFDKIDENELLEFNYGTPGQVIRGLEIALKGMKKGEKSKIIIPSHLAFGSEGSSTGIVPPFTTVIYELEIINVN
jgi:FKBP-type peptidyl-prolyl cis-trans isomerase FkpA